MAENKISTILQELRGEEERLKKELAEVRKREQELSKELRNVQAGLSGLAGGKTRSKRNTATAASGAKKSSPPQTDEASPGTGEVHVEEPSEISLDAFP